MNWQLTGAIAVASLIGLAGGIGAYTFIYARGGFVKLSQSQAQLTDGITLSRASLST